MEAGRVIPTGTAAGEPQMGQVYDPTVTPAFAAKSMQDSRRITRQTPLIRPTQAECYQPLRAISSRFDGQPSSATVSIRNPSMPAARAAAARERRDMRLR